MCEMLSKRRTKGAVTHFNRHKTMIPGRGAVFKTVIDPAFRDRATRIEGKLRIDAHTASSWDILASDNDSVSEVNGFGREQLLMPIRPRSRDQILS